jgi:Ser/Thr protein kinase RdoA (MazF antagonist)
LPAQVTHNDAQPDNIVCVPGDLSRIIGVIDFGDIVFFPPVADLTKSTVSVGNGDDPVADAAITADDFRSIATIGDNEPALLYDPVWTCTILGVQLPALGMPHTGAPVSVRAIDLPESLMNLEAALAMDPEEFFRAMSA